MSPQQTIFQKNILLGGGGGKGARKSRQTHGKGGKRYQSDIRISSTYNANSFDRAAPLNNTGQKKKNNAVSALEKKGMKLGIAGAYMRFLEGRGGVGGKGAGGGGWEEEGGRRNRGQMGLGKVGGRGKCELRRAKGVMKSEEWSKREGGGGGGGGEGWGVRGLGRGGVQKNMGGE